MPFPVAGNNRVRVIAYDGSSQPRRDAMDVDHIVSVGQAFERGDDYDEELMRRRLCSWVPPAMREASSKMENKVNNGAMTPSTRASTGAPSTPGSLAPATPSRHEFNYLYDLHTHQEEHPYQRSLADSLNEHSISAPDQLPFRQVRPSFEPPMRRQSLDHSMRRQVFRDEVACPCETPTGHAAATKLQAWRRGMMARRMYLGALYSTAPDRRVGLYVYERVDEKGGVTRPKLHALRQLLQHLGCDATGWHTFAGWRHRDPRKELLMRQGRRMELATTLSESARRLRRRILLGNIIVPARGVDFTAFRAILSQTLGHTVEIVRSWTERGKTVKTKKGKPDALAFDPPPQKTPIHYEHTPSALPETFDASFIVRVGQALERGLDPFAALPPPPGLPVPVPHPVDRRWADRKPAFEKNFPWPTVSSQPLQTDRVENPRHPVASAVVCQDKIPCENCIQRKPCQDDKLDLIENKAAMKIQAWRRGMMARRAHLVNLDIDPGRRIGLYVYERVNEAGHVTGGVAQLQPG